MGPFHTTLLITSALLLAPASTNDAPCPTKCVCRRTTPHDEIKLKCGDSNRKISSLEEIDLLNYASDIVQFNLSNNELVTFYPKVQLIALQKLDLSRNKLEVLQNDQFSELPNLRRLDLSGNQIKRIEPLAFSKLAKLERLKLNENQVATIGAGTFDSLQALKQLDISNNPLVCDCNLLWLLEFIKKKSVKLASNPSCNTPPSFKTLPLRKLKVGAGMKCGGDFPVVELRPNVSQVVFEGDALKLECVANANITGAKLEWTWLDSDPRLYFSDVEVDEATSHGAVATLNILKLSRNHTGIWNCSFDSHSKGITVVVISNETEYCPITVTSNNKGTYTWPRTVVNYTATNLCESRNYEAAQQTATYFCGPEGRWMDLDTSVCLYTSNTTKFLEQFSKLNSSIEESAKHFRNYTVNVNHFRDVMDVVFAVETMENYLKQSSIDLIGGDLMDVTNNLLQLPKQFLWEANKMHGSCEKLVNITEVLARPTSATSPLHKSNVAVEIFTVKKSGFMNLKCTWYSDVDKPRDRLFSCRTNIQNDTAELPGTTTEASLLLPETVFRQLEHDDADRHYKILVSMFSSNKLFPSPGKQDVTTSVAGVKVLDIERVNLTDPIFVTLRTPPGVVSDDLVPVRWDSSGKRWLDDGCRFSHAFHEHVVFFCHHFGYYGLMQDVAVLQKVNVGARFKLSHPVVYVGSFALLGSLLVAIVTYLACYPSIQMPKKAKHALINTWVAIWWLCFLYVFGIYQTEDVRMCQVVGMLLHYFTLSSLLWMCVAVNCMYKRLSKNDVLLQDDDLPGDPPIKKPILGLYFLGWGVAIIVCGISAAINIKDYASLDYCFLRLGPPLSALYIPFVILAVFLGVFFLLIRCAIYGLDANGHLSEGTQATENVDLDLLEPNFPNADVRSVGTTSSKTASSEIEDPEHSPSAQLKAHIIVLFVYVVTWTSCAFTTVDSHRFFSHEGDVFGLVYALSATTLGAFIIFFYCVARSDVRGQWIVLARFLKRKRACFRARTVSDAAPQVTSDLQVTSRSSSRSSTRTKSHNSNVVKAAADLNGSTKRNETKINNVNLVVLHRQQYRASVIPNIIENPTNAAEAFYNPHQSIVARKFFRRQKRYQMKRNNLVARPRDSDGEVKKTKDNSSVDQSIFGTNSKVNNTNIHVEHVQRKAHKNPNIFSDSGDDYECDVSVPNIVLNSERLRRRPKKKTNNGASVGHKVRQDNMRSVSQQCTLEYSSENVSDSILDKTSAEKIDEAPTKHQVLQSRASSVSVSDLDELYQQIRRGPRTMNSFSVTRNSPCFSDSDINAYRAQTNAGRSNLSDNVETTV